MQVIYISLSVIYVMYCSIMRYHIINCNVLSSSVQNFEQLCFTLFYQYIIYILIYLESVIVSWLSGTPYNVRTAVYLPVLRLVICSPIKLSSALTYASKIGSCAFIGLLSVIIKHCHHLSCAPFRLDYLCWLGESPSVTNGHEVRPADLSLFLVRIRDNKSLQCMVHVYICVGKNPLVFISALTTLVGNHPLAMYFYVLSDCYLVGICPLVWKKLVGDYPLLN